MNPKPKRPGTVVGAAVLLIIYGIYSVIGGACGGAIILFPTILTNMIPQPPAGAKGQPDPLAPQRAVAKEAPGYLPVTVSFTAVGILLGFGAFIAGVGVLKMSPTARSLGIAVALAVIANMVIQSAYNVAYVFPVTIRVMDEQAKANPPPPGMPDLSGITKGSMYGGLVFGILLQLLIWGIVILLLRSQSASDAFAGKFPEQPAHPVDDRIKRYDGYEDDGAPPSSPKSPGDTGITDRPS